MHIAVLMMNHGRGSGTVARQHVRALAEAGHRVTFAVPHSDRIVPGAWMLNITYSGSALPVHEYLPGFHRQRRVPEMSYDEAMVHVADLERALEAHAAGFDVIVAHHVSLSAVAAARVARRHHIPLVVFAHGTGIEPRHFGGYDDRVWAEIVQAMWAADGVIVTTDYVRDQLVRPLIELPSARFLVLPIGVDLDELHPCDAPEVRQRHDISVPFVISPGAVTKLKGAQNVVAATHRYAAHAPTIFIGEGDLRSTLQVTIGARGRFLGHVSDDDKTALMNAARLLVAAPEKREHFGIIYAEALAAGSVPVAYQGGGVDSIITPDVGVLTERDPEALGDAVAALLSDEHRRSQMAVAARTRAEKYFDRVELDRRLVEWVEAVVGLR